MRIAVAFLALALICFVPPAFAQDPSSADASKTTITTTPAAPATLDKRLELAKKMHEIRPTKDQVYSAIDQVAQSQPPADREAFKTAMRNILNYQAIEKISVDAMADTYTVEELQAMVEYYSKPEAQSASKKDSVYAGKVYPEIIRMLDEAMMKVRTGSATAPPVTAPAVPGQ